MIERWGLAVLIAVFLLAPAHLDTQNLAVCHRFDATGPWHRREPGLFVLTGLSFSGAVMHLGYLCRTLKSRPLAIALVSVFVACVAEINLNKDDYIETVNACEASLAHTVTAAMFVVLYATFCVVALPTSAMVAQLALMTIVGALLIGDDSKSRWPLVNRSVAIGLVLPLAFTLKNEIS